MVIIIISMANYMMTLRMANYTLRDGQISPNGKWNARYIGYGSAGTEGSVTIGISLPMKNHLHVMIRHGHP
jgi:hypothetical protein